jgi:hypothetical protein
MKFFEDFTETAVGTRIPMEGPVTICPRCGRTGVLEALADGGAEFVHVESEEIFGDGLLVQPVDACSLPS